MVITHEYDAAQEREVEIPAPKDRAGFLKRCTMEGGIVPPGFPVYRGDTRTWDEIQASGGFIPAFELPPGVTVPEYARNRVNQIMQVSASDFVHYWKYPKECREKECAREYRPLVFGKDGRQAGVAVGCDTQGSQKSGHDYEILLPKLYALKVSGVKMGAVGVYGDKPSLEESTMIWLHLIAGFDASEMVSLTVVPVDMMRPLS